MGNYEEEPELINQGLQKVCENCESCMKMIGLGLGYKCDDERNNFDGNWFSIPHRNHTCEYFTNRVKA